MRLFQVLDPETNEPKGLFSCSQSEEFIYDEKVEKILIEYFDLMDNDDNETASKLLDNNSIEREFVNEICI